MSTKDLINAIISGEAIEIENAFNATMAEKISARLDDMRQDVAQNLFKAPEPEAVVEEEVELTLEDYSLEEIEAYMQTEEFEQLDELDKSTLKSYFQKSQNSSQKILKKAQDPKNSSDDAQAQLKRKFTKRLTGMARAAQKFNKEEVELTEEEIDAQIQEVLSKDASAGEWIHDFVHSDNPKFEGKSKEKRKQMALAAYYAKQRSE